MCLIRLCKVLRFFSDDGVETVAQGGAVLVDGSVYPPSLLSDRRLRLRGAREPPSPRVSRQPTHPQVAYTSTHEAYYWND